MKINNISFKNQKYFYSSFNKGLNFKGNVDKQAEKEIIKLNPDGTKTVLKQIDFTDSEIPRPTYLKILGKNDKVLKDIRFDKRYNEIRAHEFEDNYNGFAYIKNSLTVSFDSNKQIRNIYLIRKKDDTVTHLSLNNNHGLSVNSYDKDNNEIPLNIYDKKEQIEFFVNFTNDILKLAQKNNLKASKDISYKFLHFFKTAL